MQFLFFLWKIKIYLVHHLGQLRNRGGFALLSVFFSGEAVKQSGRQSTIIINLFIVFLVVVADSVMCYHNCGA